MGPSRSGFNWVWGSIGFLFVLGLIAIFTAPNRPELMDNKLNEVMRRQAAKTEWYKAYEISTREWELVGCDGEYESLFLRYSERDRAPFRVLGYPTRSVDGLSSVLITAQQDGRLVGRYIRLECLSFERVMEAVPTGEVTWNHFLYLDPKKIQDLPQSTRPRPEDSEDKAPPPTPG